MDPQTLHGKIMYYCREKYYGKMQEVVKESLLRNPADPACLLFNGFALILNSRYQEGIRDLNSLQSIDDISLAVVMSLIHAHKRIFLTDRETMQQLDSKLKEKRKNASSISLYYASLFLFFSERLEKASDLINKVIKMDPKFITAFTLKGWIEMYKNPNNLTQKIADFFENEVQNNDFDASMGLATLKYLQKDFSSAIKILDGLIPKHPLSEIPLIEKMKNELALLNWDQVMELSERIMLREPENIPAMKYKIIYTVCKKGEYIDSADLIDKYYNYLEKQESKNSDCFYDSAKLFSRICGRSNSILTQTYRFVKYAAELQPSNTDYLTELGYQCLFQGKIKDAVHFFKSATKVDDNSINALCGLTLCQMSESGPSEQIEQQIELLNELMGSSNRHPVLLLMSAKLEHKFPDKALSLLNDASNVHFAKIHFLPYGIEYLKALNPDFVLELVDEYLQYAPKKPSVVLDAVIFNFEEILPDTVIQSLSLLENLTKCCPGLVPVLYRLAKTQFLYGKSNSALINAQEIVENIDQTYANAHLLLSQIYIHQNLFNRAEQSLEVCLSYNFKVRDNPMYHLLQGIIYKQKNKLTDALACYTAAINLIGNKFSSNQKSIKSINTDNDLNLQDKATLYLELINTHTALAQHPEATKIMQDAIEEFSYTTEEARLTIVNAELALYRNDVDRAIELLSQIKPGQSYYLQAHTKLANIYLKEKNDRNMFATCFREIVANHPGSDGHSMLGDAYMSIHEPRHAVEAFEKALEQNPKDLILIKKMGVALIKMHLYARAENHYIDAIESLNNPELKLDLADLFIKLKKYDRAEEVLKTELENPASTMPVDLVSMKFQTKVLTMIAKVKERNTTDSGRRLTLITLKEARENQSRLVKRAQLESHPDLEEEKKILSNICSSLAAQYAAIKSTDQAIQTYKEALQYIPQHPPVLLALSKLYMQVNEPDQCQQTCAILLNADPENEAASVMMSDLAFRKVDFETASFHLKQLLTAQPTYWTALERLIDVQRRLGNLEEVAPFITKAQESGYSQEPGYLYCAGLHARYNGDPNVALRHWGRARRAEGRWGRSAAIGVIKVCLSPGGEALPPPLSDDGSSDSPDDVEYRDTRSFALGMAERLLAELQSSVNYDAGEALELKLLGFRLTLAGRKKSTVEATLRTLLQMASEEGGIDDIGIAVAIASAYMILKQAQRARNQLKRVSRIPWTPERSEWLEMCWVLLAECLLNAGSSSSNIEAAKDCIDRALKHNKSCTQAHEYLGYLCEKEQSYKQAALHYENAWKYGGQGNASIGYKYALCLLKAKKYAEAISVSRDVLMAHPDCPKIRKEVMDKASNLLRM